MMAGVLETLTVPGASAVPSASLAPIAGSTISVLSGCRNSVRLPEFRGLKIHPIRSCGSVSWRLVRRGGRIVCEAQDTAVQGNVPLFPRVNIWNPYKRLGVSPDASEEEVWSSRNFLLDQYAGHERSVESIEAAFEKLLMDSFWNRKRTKINLKSRLKKKVEESPPWVKNLLSFVEVPPTVIILRRLFLFAFMACWSVMNSAEGGPAFQVALSLAACIYFLNDKTKSLARAAIIGFGALVVGWICGSFLVPLIPSFLLQPTWSLELLTSLVAYVFLFMASTFLK